ncbi:MAG: flagellar export chaperone FliS [Pseudomonadota bacterium]
MATSRGVNTYRRTSISSAPPHRILDECFNRALIDLAKAREAIAKRDAEGKGKALGNVLAILGELETALDQKAAPQMTRNLSRLYRYARDAVLEAGQKMSPKPLAHVEQILCMLRAAFAEAASKVAANNDGKTR